MNKFILIYICALMISVSSAEDSKLKPKENEAWVYIKDWVILIDVKSNSFISADYLYCHVD